MRLIDLDPRWLMVGARRVGLIFRSPTKPSQFYQSCMFEALGSKEQRELFNAALNDEYGYTHVQGCKQGIAWKAVDSQKKPIDVSTTSFETLSVLPSLDGSAGGLWHGHIRNGQMDNA